MKFKIKSIVFKYPGAGGWHFATIPKKESALIKKHRTKKVGWGSVKIEATIGKTSWQTSLFPNKDGTYLLPIKANVRKQVGIEEGFAATIAIKMR